MSDAALRAGIDQAVVFEDESTILRQRRQVAGLPSEKFEHGWFEKSPAGAVEASGSARQLGIDRPPLADADPVGLALSGGGVRSAAFALGIIQAFHRFGLMRYVDYLSAVSGGTYAAGMFIQSVKKNHPYGEQNCDLAPDRSGQSSEFVQRVSSRGNYLFRSDLFLARFIPGFVLNLAPQLCLLIAIGSGLALLWRCLDFHRVRDHLGVFAIDDLGAAFLPAILLGMLWLLSYVAGLVAASQPLKRISTWMLAATCVSLLIGAAIVIGNGDVTFNTPPPSKPGEEPRITWLNNLWTPLVSVVALGCIPLLMPKKLLRSGTQPRGWFDSWIFYYVSLALFIGVPLISVGYFAKENISRFNNTRGPTFLPADIKDPRLLANLLDPTDPKQLVLQLDDPDLRITLAAPATDATAILALQLKELSKLADARHDVDLDLRKIKQYPTPMRANGTSAERVSWYRWRYLSNFELGPTEFIAYWLGSGGEKYKEHLRIERQERDLSQIVVKNLTALANKQPLFSFSVLPRSQGTSSLARSAPQLSPPTTITLLAKDLPNDLKEQLLRIRSELSSRASPPGVVHAQANATQTGKLPPLPVHTYASLNRNLLEAALPNVIRNRSELRRTNLIGYDQYHRLIWFVGSLTAAIILGWCINPNQTGLHGYYRDRLAGTYLNRGKNQVGTVFPELDTDPLSDVSAHEQGAAYPLFQTSVLTRQAWEHADQLQRPFRPFVLSPAYCGNRHLKYVDTRSLGKHQPSVADTIAISGGAIDPAFFVHHILAFLVNAMNWRMGQLFPNPQATHWQRPNMLQVLVDTLRQSLSSSEGQITANVLLTDGGHSENLGIEPLLCRRCRLIIVSDAGYDPDHVLDDLAKVVRRLESSEGIRLVDVLPSHTDSSPADGQPLRIPGNMAAPMDANQCDASIRARHELVDRLFKRLSQQTEKRHFFVAKILYPECGAADSDGNCEHPEFEGRMIYIKPCLTGDEGLQLCNYAFRHSEFPHESTLDQAFDEAQFEAYRRLGFHSGVDLCRDLPDPQGVDRKDRESSLWSTDKPWNLNKVCDRLLGRDNFGATAIHNRVRSQIEEVIKRWSTEADALKIVQELQSLGNDLSLAADLLVQLPAHDGPFPLNVVEEHLDQRAVAPLANLLDKRAQAADQNDVIQRAIQWLDQLARWDDQIDLQRAISPLAEVARWTHNPTTGCSAIALLKLIAATSAERKPEVLRGLRTAIKNQSTEEVRVAARTAITTLQQRPPETPPDPTSNGRAKSDRETTYQAETRPIRRRR